MSRQLFEQLKSEGGTLIDDLIARREQETLSLEFKTKEAPATPDLSRDDRKNLGKTLSAFSNSVGGLLVWGIEARRDAEGLDAASDRIPISNLQLFQTKVTGLLGDLLRPINTAIEVVDIPDLDRNDGSGYLAVWVPRSDRRPHCSGQDHHYYKRSGDSSRRMEHFDIEDMFMSRKSASIDLVSKVEPTGRGTTQPSMKIKISLQNHSKITARFPYLNIRDNSEFILSRFGLDGNGTFGLPNKPMQENGHTLFSGGSNDVLNPGQSLLICHFDIAYDDNQQKFICGRVITNTNNFSLNCFFGCEGMPQTEKFITIDLLDYI